MRRPALLVLALALHGAGAQDAPALEIALPAATALTQEGPTVRAAHVLSDPGMRDLIHSGFPAQLHFRVELWSAAGLFDTMRGSAEWDVIVRFDALSERYRVLRRQGDSIVPVGQYARYDDAAAEVERARQAPLVAGHEASRQYYVVTLTMETMSQNDLDEVERWLRGELKPAVRGQRNPGTALGTGVRRLFVKLLGGERRTLQARTGTFRVR